MSKKWHKFWFIFFNGRQAWEDEQYIEALRLYCFHLIDKIENDFKEIERFKTANGK